MYEIKILFIQGSLGKGEKKKTRKKTDMSEDQCTLEIIKMLIHCSN